MLKRVGLLLFLLTAVSANAQEGGFCGPNPPTTFSVKGRVIAPGANFDRYHEILQLDETRLVAFGYTGSTGEYTLPEQPAGQYYIVVRIDGFKEYREKVYVRGAPKYMTTSSI